MYSFEDSSERRTTLTLRPEGTAGCVRAVIQHNLAAHSDRNVSITWGRCSGTNGRRKGRYRQFNQVGVESFGFAGPDIDAEQILMGARLVG
jgi:histidyl-tRNA synthetase